MSEEGQQHPQEPAEGGEGDAKAPRAERPGEVEESVGNLTDAPAGLEHPAEPAKAAKGPSRRGVPSDKGAARVWDSAADHASDAATYVTSGSRRPLVLRPSHSPSGR
jgi:hypothetical protein